MFHIYSEGVSNSDGSLRYYLQDDLSIEAFDNVHGVRNDPLLVYDYIPSSGVPRATWSLQALGLFFT